MSSHKLSPVQKSAPGLPTQDDIIEAKEFNIQLFFERYKGKLVLRN